MDEVVSPCWRAATTTRIYLNLSDLEQTQMLIRNKAPHFMQIKYWIGAALVWAMCLLPSVDAQAQIMVTDANGDKIILMPDGSWRYADDEKQATVPKQVKDQQQKGEVKVDKKKLSKAERKALKQQRKDQKRREKILKKLEKQRQRESDKSQKSSKSSQKNQKPDAAKPQKKGKDGLTKAERKAAKKAQADAEQAAKKAAKSERKSAKGKTDNAKVSKSVKRAFKPFKTPEVVIYTPPCNYQMNEVDPFTGKRKIALDPAFFFGYTHPRLERFMQGGHYLTCEAYVSEVASLRALNVKFIIDSPNAKNDYGTIQEGSRLLINLLDGETIVLAAGEYSAGKIDPIKKQTIYSTYFIIDSKSEKKLKRGEISQVRFVWSEGFEDYEVYKMDFIAHQLKCLDAAP